MAYEIPKNLNQYSEQFLWGLTLKQFCYAAGGLALNALVIFRTALPTVAKAAILIPIDIIILLFAVGGLEQVLTQKRNLKKSLQNTAYYDRNIDSFMDVKEIKEDCAVRKDGTVLAVLEVTPINFVLQSDDQKEHTIYAYRQWLRGLDFPVQVVSRSIPLDVDKWLEKVPKSKQGKNFANWMKDQIAINNVRDRRFYVILQHRSIQSEPASKQLLSLVTGKSVAQSSIEISRKKLNERIEQCGQALAQAGVISKKLEEKELLQLYASYFSQRADIDPSATTPIMSLNQRSESKFSKLLEVADDY